MKKLRVGIIGLGGAGIVLLQLFERNKNCEVIGVLDTEDVTNRYRISKSIKIIQSEEEFYDLNLDVAAVSTPDKTHAYYISRLLDLKIHVLCEKPLTDSEEGLKDIERAIARNPEIKIMVQHQMRNVPLFSNIKHIIDSEELGEIGYLEGYYVHNLKERAFIHGNWRNEDIATPLIYSGIHLIDLIMWFIKEKPVEVYAMANNILFPEYAESDLNVLLMKFPSGKIAKVITAFGVSRPQDHSIQIYGEKASIFNNLLFKGNSHKVFQGPITKSIEGRKYAILKDAIFLLFHKAFVRLMKLFPINDQYIISYYPFRLYEHHYAVKKSVDSFINSVLFDTDPLIPLMETKNAVKVAIAGVQSYRNGNPVKLDWDENE